MASYHRVLSAIVADVSQFTNSLTLTWNGHSGAYHLVLNLTAPGLPSESVESGKHCSMTLESWRSDSGHCGCIMIPEKVYQRSDVSDQSPLLIYHTL